MTDLPPTDLQGIWKHLFTTLVVLFGAVVHATVKLKIARDNRDERFNYVDFIILFIIACFAGLVFSLLARYFFNNEYMINLCASIGAFLGIVGVNTIGQAILEMLTHRVNRN